MNTQCTTGPLRIKGHALEHFRTGPQSGYANGRCRCGWKTQGWYSSREDVAFAYRGHLRAIARAAGSQL